LYFSLLCISTCACDQIAACWSYAFLKEGVDLGTEQSDEGEQVEEGDDGEDETE